MTARREIRDVEPACEAWFVLSIDAAAIARVIFTNQDEDRCHNVAEDYWETKAMAGEDVIVRCNHDALTHEALEHSVE